MSNNISIVDIYTIIFNNNKSLVKCIYWLKIETVHVIMEILKFITYISDEIFVR